MPSRRSLIRSELVSLAALSIGVAACGDTTPSVPQVSVEYDAELKSRISISGVSAGGYLAHQAHVAYADKVGGVAVIAGGPYHCAEGSVQTALARCMTGEGLEVQPLADFARQFAEAGDIAALDELASSRVWIFHSPSDSVVSPTAGAALRDFYASFVPQSGIAFVDNVQAAHGWVTAESGAACAELGGDYINACGYDSAGEALGHTYGELQPRGDAVPENLLTIDVSGYFDSDSNVADMAYAYVPGNCGENIAGCRLHIALHGCTQGAEFIEDRFVTQVGINEWAETNEIVVVYPQLEKSIFNPKGCWDWWGYTDDDYDRRSGPQVAGISAIIDAFASGTLLKPQPVAK